LHEPENTPLPTPEQELFENTRIEGTIQDLHIDSLAHHPGQYPEQLFEPKFKQPV
jgi:hypothetical protein